MEIETEERTSRAERIANWLKKRLSSTGSARFPFQFQRDEADCGPTCLMMIARHYGRKYSLPDLRERCHLTKTGVTLLGISECANSIGLRSVGVRIPASVLEETPVPFIAHWTQNHFVVVYEVGNGVVRIADPASGQRELTTREFLKGCASAPQLDGEEAVTILMTEPTPEFYSLEGVDGDKGISWARLARYLGRYRRLLVRLGCIVSFGLLLNLAAPFLTQAVVDSGIRNKNINLIYLILIGQLMVFAGKTIAQFVQSRIVLHVGQSLNISIVSDFLQKMMGLPISFFDRRTVGDVLQRIHDHSRLDQFLTSTALSAVISISSVLIYGAILLYYHPLIFLVFAIGSAASVSLIQVFMRRRRSLDDRRFAELSDSQNNVVQLVTGITDIKLNNVEDPKRQEWEEIQHRRFKTNLDRLALEQQQQGGIAAIQQLSNILIVFVAAKSVIDETMTLGMMMAVQQIVGQLTVPISEITRFTQSYQEANLSLDRIGEIYQHSDEEISEPLPILEDRAAIELNGVSFQYEGPGSPHVLRNLSLVVPRGSVTAIVGASGSGKTTLLKLLLKFYSPAAGTIRVGGVDLSSVSPKDWRSRCGVVLQDGFLFNDSIARNIALNAEDVDESKVRHAAKLAQIFEFVESLPHGFETRVGKEGLGLSQGQRQRILIARALYKDPEYLFLDEATSALDSSNERAFLEKMQEFFEGRTVLVIAHRLSTVKRADQIVVLDRGKVAEKGTHAELTARRGSYFNLVQNQLELETSAQSQ